MSTAMSAKPVLTGRKVLLLLVGFFSIVFLVNGVMIHLALKTFPGVEDARPYERGLAYDREIAQALAPILISRGLLLVGLDVIGENLTEINVTSPTCFREITAQTGFDVAALFIDALERAVKSGTRPSGAAMPG